MSAIDLTLPLDGRQIGDQELMARLSIKKSLFYELKGQGKFDFLLARPQVTSVSRYCGALVKLYVDGTKPQHQQAGHSQTVTRDLRAVVGGRK